jgi:hypothetical protein
MHASRVAIVIVACLAAAVAAWRLRLPGEDAELAAAAVAFVSGAGAAAALLRRRLVAGMTAICAGIGLWAATGGVDEWIDPRARLLVGGGLGIALLALVFAGDPRDDDRDRRAP